MRWNLYKKKGKEMGIAIGELTHFITRLTYLRKASWRWEMGERRG